MFQRTLTPKIQHLFTKFPAIALLGPRQSGKTTLSQLAFPHLPYINLEKLTDRNFATEDPTGFLNQYPNGAILDEIQYVPDLMSYLQLRIDEKNIPGLYVITGSQNLFLNQKIGQTLAGRIAITTLLPLSYQELQPGDDWKETIYKGFYPRVYNNQIDPVDFYPNYIQTYIEKDVRQIKSIANLSLFQKFLGLCAGRIGQILNLHSLSNDCGISHSTAREWMSILEMSYIVYLLKPYFNSFNKTLIKSPKLYFCDTGIACSLLNIQDPSVLQNHFMKGVLFENLIVTDLLKNQYNHGLQPHLYFWHDRTGHEVDILLDDGKRLTPVEIKSGETINQNYFSNIQFFQKLAKTTEGKIIYGGIDHQNRTNCEVMGAHQFLLNKNN